MSYQSMAQKSKKTIPITLEAKDWQLLPPPPLSSSSSAEAEAEKIQVGVIEIHPNNEKIAYATRRRSDHCRDLGKELIVVQDINRSGDTTSANETEDATTAANSRICSFTLRDLIKHLNQFRADNYLASISNLKNAEQILKGGHLDAVTSLTVPLLSVQLLGAVQNISFFDRDALHYTVAPGLIAYCDGYSNDATHENHVARLCIGFRRCMVVLSILTSSYNNHNELHVEAYIGPENVDEYENVDKIQKRQPSSFAIPISEYILAYGCYDGGIRFYDINKRQQAKACLGPNGRANPIVKMVNANPKSSHSFSRPRIVSTCVSATAYLWELDISIDLPTGLINHFDIPPPLACFDGMVAAVSARGLPVTYPPPLSPTSRATLSPCSSWDQTDLLHEQFRICYDIYQDRLCFVFSPDCVGTSLNPHATRQERLSGNGVLAFWNLSNLPSNEWPPPSVAPFCITSIPRTKSGRVLSDLTLPSYLCNSDGLASSSLLITLYATTANEIVAAVTSLDDDTDCVQMGVSSASLVDLSTLQLLDGRSGFECYSFTFSSSNPTIIAVGTQHGALIARVFVSSSSWAKNASEQPMILAESSCIGKTGSGELLSVMNLSKNDFAEHAPSDLELSSTTNTVDIVELQEELRRVVQLLEEEKEKNAELAFELVSANKKAESQFRSSEQSNMIDASMKEPRALLTDDDSTVEGVHEFKRRLSDVLSQVESEITSHNDKDDDVSELTGEHVHTIQEENEELRRQVHELIANKDDVSEISNDGDHFVTLEREKLQMQLSIAKEKVQSLREYVELLEQNRDAVEGELENARQVAERNATLVENLQTDVYEQRAALAEMAILLEKQQQNHADAIARITNVSQKSQHDLIGAENAQLKEETVGLKAENSQLKAELSQQIALTTAIKLELQNTLNELAEHKR